MKGFLVRLDDRHRSALESYRAGNGLRSESDAIRHMIESWLAGTEEPPDPLANPLYQGSEEWDDQR